VLQSIYLLINENISPQWRVDFLCYQFQEKKTFLKRLEMASYLSPLGHFIRHDRGCARAQSGRSLLVSLHKDRPDGTNFILAAADSTGFFG
jgi:hypothetical protein